MTKAILIASLFTLVSCDEDDETKEEISEDSTVYAFTHAEKDYEVIKQNKSWQDAVAFAVAKGGYLSEVNNEDEQDAIFSELTDNAGIVLDDTNNQFGFGAVWIGGNDLATEGSWVWDGNNDGTGIGFWKGEVDGSPVDGLYNNWGNEPDNNGDQDALCIGLETTPLNSSGAWTDLDGDGNQLFFVIEYD